MSIRLKVKSDSKQNINEADLGTFLAVGTIAGSLISTFLAHLGMKNKKQQIKVQNELIRDLESRNIDLNNRNETLIKIAQRYQQRPEEVSDILNQEGVETTPEQVKAAAEDTVNTVQKQQVTQTVPQTSAQQSQIAKDKDYFAQAPEVQTMFAKKAIEIAKNDPKLQRDVYRKLIAAYQNNKEGFNLQKAGERITQKLLQKATSDKAGKATKTATPAKAQAATPTAQTPAAPAASAKQSSPFIDSLNKLKKTFKLNKEQTQAIKNLNIKFMRASHKLDEATRTFGQTYIKDSITAAINSEIFNEFDKVEKDNIITYLNKVFLSIYFPKNQPGAPAVGSAIEKPETSPTSISAEPAAQQTQQSAGGSTAAQAATSTENPAQSSSDAPESYSSRFRKSQETYLKSTQEYNSFMREYNKERDKVLNTLSQNIDNFVQLNKNAESSKDLMKRKLSVYLIGRQYDNSPDESDYTVFRVPNNDGATYNTELLNFMKEEIPKMPSFDQFVQQQKAASQSQESLYEGLFNKFKTNKQPKNSKQLFSFDGDKFKKYNRG